MSLTVCTDPSCPELVTRGRCAKHRREAEQKRGTPASRGYTNAWRKVSAAFLERHPACNRCGNLAEHAHHHDGLGPNGPRGHDLANLEALCHSCHSKVTAREQPGGWARDRGPR